MKKQIAQLLEKTAETDAVKWSDSNRSRNFNGETFKVSQIVPLSEHTATVRFEKTGGKIAIAFYYLIKGDRWWHFFPTDSHIIGMQQFPQHKEQAEQDNWMFNFPIE